MRHNKRRFKTAVLEVEVATQNRVTIIFFAGCVKFVYIMCCKARSKLILFIALAVKYHRVFNIQCFDIVLFSSCYEEKSKKKKIIDCC